MRKRKALNDAGPVRAARVDFSLVPLARALGLPADVEIERIDYDPMVRCHYMIITGGQLPQARAGDVLLRLQLWCKSAATTELTP